MRSLITRFSIKIFVVSFLGITTSLATHAEALDVALMKMSDSINMQGPKLLSKDMRVDNVQAQGNTLAYHVTIINTAPADVDKGLIQKHLENILINHNCHGDGTKKLMRGGATMKYGFFDPQGTEIATIHIPPSACN